MVKLQRVVKPRTHKAKLALESREPKLIENTKTALFLHGHNTSELTRRCLKDLFALKRNFAKHMHQKNKIMPFEDVVPLEKFAQQYDSSLFGLINHSKKRPHNLILGRMFDYHLLDMVELGLEQYKSLTDIPGTKVSVGTKCCLVFCGPDFESDEKYKRLKSLLLDFFRGVEATSLRLQGFEHALFFFLNEGKLYIRSYKILFRKSGMRKPRVELMEIGPSSTMAIRRTKFASKDLFKKACKQPQKLQPKKKKNISKNALGTKLGRVHMTKQDIDNLQTRKVRALKSDKKSKSPAGVGNDL
ncbi:UNVERIFIED_CONTAM: hypothetical protein RMT77_016074 [Armadillidium vulgare]